MILNIYLELFKIKLKYILIFDVFREFGRNIYQTINFN